MATRTIGIILIIIGAIMILYTGFNYVTTETVVDLGPIKVESEKNNFMKLSPILGIVLLIGGLLMVFLKKNK